VVVSVPRRLLERLGQGPVGLTERETEIVLLAARGLSNRQIAAELHVAEATVKRHPANVYAKIGTQSRLGTMRMAMT
jgi:ATP/maltotriose-dependent transcriptional regulator MalT